MNETNIEVINQADNECRLKVTTSHAEGAIKAAQEWCYDKALIADSVALESGDDLEGNYIVVIDTQNAPVSPAKVNPTEI